MKTLMDTTNAKLKGERRRRKRENEGINRRKDTLVKTAFELGEFDGVDVALEIRRADDKACPVVSELSEVIALARASASRFAL